jgi:hypothetical protein
MKAKLQALRALAARNAKSAGLAAAAMYYGVAHAALDTAVSTELSNANTDVKAIGALVFGIAVAIVLYKWFKRAL